MSKEQVFTDLGQGLNTTGNTVFLLQTTDGCLLVLHRWNGRLHLRGIEETCPYCKGSDLPLAGIYHPEVIADEGV